MKFHHILLAAALSLGFVACGDDNDEPDAPSWGSGITVKQEVLLAGDKAQTLNIKAAVEPTLTTDAAWLSIGAPQAKAGGIYAVELKAEPNATGLERTADVLITAGSDKATVKVTQHTSDVVFVSEVLPEGKLDALGGTLTVKYTSTADVTFALPSWVKEVSGRALTPGEATFEYTANYSRNERTAEIGLAIGGKTLASVSIIQNPAADLPQQMGSTAKELAAKMFAGINIGNTMECPTGEGAWSMRINEDYIQGIADLGFNAVRVPCAWDSHVSDPATNTIDPAWLDRVDEVIGYIIGRGMYAILNIHWDGGWLENTCKNGYDADVDKKQHDYWTQIAEKLNHYDEHLLLAAMNEPNHNDQAPQTSADAIMRYQQTMLDAVRATGGNNASRVLVMQAPNTNIAVSASGVYHMPADVVEDRLMVEVHYYDTYQFNMMENDENWGKTHWYWGAENFVSGSDRNSPHTPDDVRREMQKMKTHYVDLGIPAIIGEYCVCVDRSNYTGIDKARHQASLRLWNRVVTREAKNAGCVPFFWETGGDINRANGTVKRAYQLDGVMDGAAEGSYPF